MIVTQVKKGGVGEKSYVILQLMEYHFPGFVPLTPKSSHQYIVLGGGGGVVCNACNAVLCAAPSLK